MVTLRDLAEYGRLVMFGGIDPGLPGSVIAPKGSPVGIGSGSQAAGWQREAWRLWKHVGELHYPTTRLSRQTAQLGWRVRVNGRELTPNSAKAEIAAVTAGIGSQEATYLLALNDQVSGEAWYVEEKPDQFAVWSVVQDEIDKKVNKVRSAGRIAIRIWQSDPTDPSKADSSVRTALGPAEELMTLEALSQAQSRSRLSQAGVIITPAEQLYAAADPWEANLLEAMTNAIRDVRSPSALAPIHVRMRRDLIDTVRYITFPRPYDDLIDRKQERAIRRVANALDIEPELILGLGEATYWNAWAVSMDTYQAHIAPRADRIGQLYAEVAEQLRMRRAPDGSPQIVIEVTPDPRVMLARRSTTRDAFDAWKLGLVNAQYVRDAIGATEADRATDADLEILDRVNGGGNTMNRERRVGENPGPARTSPSNSQTVTDPSIISDVEAAAHARKEMGLRLREAWRNTPHRNRLSDIQPSDYACWIPGDDIAREMPISEVITDAVKEVALPSDVDRLASWIMDTLTVPLDTLRAREVIDAESTL